MIEMKQKFGICMLMFCFLTIHFAIAQNGEELNIPDRSNVWVFIMAGQSNMAGRGMVESQDTITNPRILTLDESNELALAKEPLHYYEPKMAGLDCGMSFATELLKHIPDSITVLMIPTAVGGSSMRRWLDDKQHRGINLQSNFASKLTIAKQYGEVRAILWHQGESDINEKGVLSRKEDLTVLFSKFREITKDKSLPILVGELGSYSKEPLAWRIMNEATRQYVESDINCALISTSDLKDKGDCLHFNSAGQRELGKRFAKSYVASFRK